MRVVRHDRRPPVKQVRIDRWRLDTIAAEVDPTTGWMTVTGTAAVVGVMDYADDYAEFVPIETLQDFSSLIGVPVTVDHPDENLDMQTTRDAQRGTVLSASMDGDALRVVMRITDVEAAQALMTGMRELSPGYDADVLREPGVFKGRAYQAVQKKRKYNHLSIVDRARGGRRVRVDRQRTDGLLVQRSDMQEELIAVTIDGTEYMVPAAVAAALSEKQAADAKDAAAESEEDKEDAAPPAPTPPAAPAPAAPAAKGRGTSVSIKMDTETVSGIVDEVEKRLIKAMRADRALERKDAQEFGEAVARTKPFLPASYRFDGKDTQTLIADAICNARPDLKGLVKGHRTDAAYLRGVFDLIAATPKSGDVAESSSEASNRTDAADDKDPVSSAQNKQSARMTMRSPEAPQLAAVNGGKQ